MWRVLVLLELASFISGQQNQYRVVQENVTLNYVDAKYVAATATIYRLNRTANALNMTFEPKIASSNITKVYIKGFKRIKGDYKLEIIGINKTFQAVTEMKLFDLQALWLDHCRPPFVWPLEKGVTYRALGWVPDSTKFPPHLPEGKLKFQVVVTLGNNTKIIVGNYFIKLIYK